MILAMVRHGQTYYNASGLIQGRINIPLNETGKMQAKELANMLISQGEIFDIIASSPLSRSLETASIIAKELKHIQPIVVEQRFVERDFFHLDGQPAVDAMPLVRQKNYTYQGYENDQLLINRVVTATQDFYQSFPDKRVLFIAHSHVIKALRVHVDPLKFTFLDTINNMDIIYFEIEDGIINFMNQN
ncbi:MAG: phosphoglycerate mutase family protein [Firmicutes bacterium]|nr:phosphoglycerate mutase family protein [Bacillota bacterium]